MSFWDAVWDVSASDLLAILRAIVDSLFSFHFLISFCCFVFVFVFVFVIVFVIVVVCLFLLLFFLKSHTHPCLAHKIQRDIAQVVHGGAIDGLAVWLDEELIHCSPGVSIHRLRSKRIYEYLHDTRL